MNRKGTEKPIEIFVALFIILAVALVMLKLFQGQITQQQSVIANTQAEQKNRELFDKVKLSCQQRCTDASNNGCSLASLAALCSYGSINELSRDEYLDLNNDKQMDLDTTLLAGIGVCEDHIYCFHLLDSCCAQKIDARNCKDILRKYWLSQGFTQADPVTGAPEQIFGPAGLLNKTVNPGICAGDPTVRHWDDIATWGVYP